MLPEIAWRFFKFLKELLKTRETVLHWLRRGSAPSPISHCIWLRLSTAIAIKTTSISRLSESLGIYPLSAFTEVSPHALNRPKFQDLQVITCFWLERTAGGRCCTFWRQHNYSLGREYGAFRSPLEVSWREIELFMCRKNCRITADRRMNMHLAASRDAFPSFTRSPLGDRRTVLSRRVLSPKRTRHDLSWTWTMLLSRQIVFIYAALLLMADEISFGILSFFTDNQLGFDKIWK